MNAVRHLFGSLLLLLVSLPVAAQSKSDADYQAMLGWLASSRIEGNALSGTSGAVAVNQAAGDNNLQGNLRAVAVGEYADTCIQPLQRSSANTSDTPRHAEAFIGEGALARSSGLVSINQASGSDNIELNTVALALAQRGIREADDGFLSASGVASAGVQNVSEPGEHRRKPARWAWTLLPCVGSRGAAAQSGRRWAKRHGEQAADLRAGSMTGDHIN